MKNLITDFKERLAEPRNDGGLHFSQHLQHDRHTAIYYALGYPKNPYQSWGSMFPLLQGTAIHEIIHSHMEEMYDIYNPEVPVTTIARDTLFPWSGTLDALVEDNDGNPWLLDYKTISGAGIGFLEDSPKPEHILQVSAYYHFANLDEDFRTAIVYFPSSPDYKRQWSEPMFMEFEPVTRQEILDRMYEVEKAITDYLGDGTLPDSPEGEYRWKKQGKAHKLIYKPHYTTMFCPWGHLHDDPCGCSSEQSKTIATYKGGHLTVADEYATLVETIGVPDDEAQVFPEV